MNNKMLTEGKEMKHEKQFQFFRKLNLKVKYLKRSKSPVIVI